MIPDTFAYYPGCTLHSTEKEYDVSARLVCAKLGLKLQELEDWTCCGASSAHTINELLSIALPARDLQKAEKMGLPIVAACALCFSRLKHAAHALIDKEKLDLINNLLGNEFHNTTEVFHLLKVLYEKRDAITPSRPLGSLKIACYYGCLLVRPREIVDLDDVEDPQIMDRLMERLGAVTVDWGFKTECCGASLPITKPEMVLKLSHRILSQAKQAGADCVAVACPMCHNNLDAYQKDMKKKYSDEFELPVLYFTQLVGLALGFSPKQLLLDKHFTSPLPMLRDKGLADEGIAIAEVSHG
ncbi:MAG TPA: CoB--CoM heterodisulfide reductase iron-sulfur subunit B family protein [Dehalococcoidia bacterium]|nr:CoB--CoM heterodisulfide reductase iron-sulfur subunit B family protein [Dehalococcoidia bacterium]